MAVQETALKESSAVMVTVNERAKAVSIGALKAGAWDAQKALNIASALIACLEPSFSYVRHNPTYSVEES